MPFRSIVLVKQVPDTKNITGDAMTPEGTVNRAALPAVFNPEDLNALEMALGVKDREGGEVIALTMGPPSAMEVLREALYRGADRAILLTDRKFAGADTLATSYALACAIGKVGPFDMVFAGRQAIDGDTAQVGPQTAEKLGIPQITYAESIESFGDGKLVARRALDHGSELVRCSLPCLLTVVGSAPAARPASVRRRIARKRETGIESWTAADIGAEESRLGFAGSPTQVHKVNFVVLEGTESKDVAATAAGISALVDELVREYVIG
jgi:electron transfer flavoprotein beta subunit